MIETRPGEDGIVASAFALVEIDAVKQVRADEKVFTAGEEAYARAKRDPERRLAARLAAKQAAQRLLGGGAGLGEIEVARGQRSVAFRRHDFRTAHQCDIVTAAVVSGKADTIRIRPDAGRNEIFLVKEIKRF